MCLGKERHCLGRECSGNARQRQCLTAACDLDGVNSISIVKPAVIIPPTAAPYRMIDTRAQFSASSSGRAAKTSVKTSVKTKPWCTRVW